jgi:hypothetical protein
MQKTSFYLHIVPLTNVLAQKLLSKGLIEKTKEKLFH